MLVLVPALLTIATQLPVILVWIGGLVVAVLRRRDDPAAARLIGVALVVLLLVAPLHAALHAGVPEVMRGQGSTAGEVGAVLLGVDVGASGLQALAWILALIAVFGRRAGAAPGEVIPVAGAC